jgi:integrase
VLTPETTLNTSLVRVTAKPPLSDDWRPLISFLIFTGLRITEALNVKWEDIDLEAGTVTVGVSKTRAGTGRSVILIPALASTLRRHRLRSHYSASESYVFPNAKGEMGDRNYILAKVLKPATKAAGVTEVTLHELRHTFASILIGQGFDVTFVADQLGHSDPGITLKVYAKLYDPAQRRNEAREKLQTAFGGLL